MIYVNGSGKVWNVIDAGAVKVKLSKNIWASKFQNRKVKVNNYNLDAVKAWRYTGN